MKRSAANVALLFVYGVQKAVLSALAQKFQKIGTVIFAISDATVQS